MMRFFRRLLRLEVQEAAGHALRPRLATTPFPVPARLPAVESLERGGGGVLLLPELRGATQPRGSAELRRAMVQAVRFFVHGNGGWMVSVEAVRVSIQDVRVLLRRCRRWPWPRQVRKLDVVGLWRCRGRASVEADRISLEQVRVS